MLFKELAKGSHTGEPTTFGSIAHLPVGEQFFTAAFEHEAIFILLGRDTGLPFEDVAHVRFGKPHFF